MVEFTTGPNLFEYDFDVVCYEQDVAVPTDSCGAVAAAVAAGDLSPLGSERGTLPRSRAGVAVTVTGLPQNADVDCFVEVGGGPIGFVGYCQYAGLTTTAGPTGTTLFVTNSGSSSVTGGTAAGDGSLTDVTSTGSPNFNNPNGIAISGTTAYVTNYGGNSVTQCTIDGTSLTGCVELTGATFNDPVGIAIIGA